MKKNFLLLMFGMIFLFVVISSISAYNLAFNKTYYGTTNVTKAFNYLDNGTLFTDAWYGNPAAGFANYTKGYFGFWNTTSAIQVNETIDLGSIGLITDVNTTLLTDTTDSIILPYNVSLWISNDNLTFTYKGNLTLNDTNHAGQINVFGFLNLNATARYVRFVYSEPASSWLFISEGQVGGNFSSFSSVALIFPLNNSYTVSSPALTVNYTVASNLSNVTYYLWIDNIIKDTHFQNITGLNNQSIYISQNLTIGNNYIWNVFYCTVSNCSWSDNGNFTFQYVKFAEINQTYVNSTFSGSSNSFSLTANVTSGLSVSSAYLNYNGTNYSATWLNNNGLYVLSASALAPTVTLPFNQSFSWFVTLSDSSVFRSSINNQTVNPFAVDNCLINSNKIYQYKVYDEDNLTLLPNATIEYNLNLLSGGNVIANFSKLLINNSLSVCINVTLSQSQNYTVNSIVKYSSSASTGYVTRYYNIRGGIISNSSVPVNISLYDLLSSEATAFKIVFTDQDFVPVQGALVYLEREYVSQNDSYFTVELPLTDSSGAATVFMIQNIINYNILFVKDGILLAEFDKQTAFCNPTTGACEIDLNAKSNLGTGYNYNTTTGLYISNLAYNDTTGIVMVNFIVPDGSVSTITLNATRSDVFGNYSVCNSLVTSAGGTISCQINTNNQAANVRVTISINGVPSRVYNIAVNGTNYGSVGYFAWFLLTLILIFAFDNSKSAVLLSMVFSFAGAILLGIISGTLVGYGAMGLWIIIIAVLGVWKLNKNRIQ